MASIYFIVSTLINLWAFLNVGQTDTVGLEDLISVDRDLETTLRTQIDFFYPAFVCFVTIQLSAYLRFIKETKSAYFITVVMTKFSSVQAVLMKHMVLKRMKCIQEKVVGTRNILDIVPLTRRILGFNLKVNSVLSLCVANAISTGLLQFLASISSYWKVYGLHNMLQCYESTSPVLTAILQTHIITELLFLAGTSRRISNWLEVFMLEMAHTSTDLTALELLVVDNSFLTSAGEHPLTPHQLPTLYSEYCHLWADPSQVLASLNKGVSSPACFDWIAFLRAGLPFLHGT
ncbi:hypothetical protein J6590_085441 [Homalodisca vitripennis]|nr:hypothetical protein J6590_085441 [Homalodisca vitripennis]